MSDFQLHRSPLYPITVAKPPFEHTSVCHGSEAANFGRPGTQERDAPELSTKVTWNVITLLKPPPRRASLI